MPNMTIQMNTRRPFGQPRPRKEGLNWIINHLQGIASGVGRQSDVVAIAYSDVVGLGNDAYVGPAAAALVFSSASGAVGGNLGGTAVTVTAAGGDINTASLVTTAIRANQTINRSVMASNLTMQVTLTSVLAGSTVQICGQPFAAVNGALSTFGQFDISGSDTADAASLALAINRHPALAGKVRAVSSAAIVYIALIDLSQAPSASLGIQSPPVTMTIQRGTPTAGPVVVVMTVFGSWGPIGNFYDISASGTGVALATNGAASKLGNGTGAGDVAPYTAALPSAAFSIFP